jgi:hypothetical protein
MGMYKWTCTKHSIGCLCKYNCIKYDDAQILPIRIIETFGLIDMNIGHPFEGIKCVPNCGSDFKYTRN